MTEADIKRGEHLFTTECGYTDTRHRANLVDKKVSEDILRKIEDGCSIETLEELLAGQFPICKYKTQITIHGLFPHLATERVGRYKNLVRNKNQSVGVRWTAIDHKKRADIFRLAYICDKWGIVENSQEFFLQRVEPVTTDAELAATLDAFRETARRIEAASNLFQGGVRSLQPPQHRGHTRRGRRIRRRQGERESGAGPGKRGTRRRMEGRERG